MVHRTLWPWKFTTLKSIMKQILKMAKKREKKLNYNIANQMYIITLLLFFIEMLQYIWLWSGHMIIKEMFRGYVKWHGILFKNWMHSFEVSLGYESVDRSTFSMKRGSTSTLHVKNVFHWNVTIYLAMKWSHDYKRDVSHPNETQIRTCMYLHDDFRCKQSMA
jgi:hypothetical protein